MSDAAVSHPAADQWFEKRGKVARVEPSVARRQIDEMARLAYLLCAPI
jgi:hypothetical protein